ncbi:MAG: branched-chain amino acid ABC transporter permease [Deltaproteobacteria bacterium]|nr:branched-chain amino acid ABC transporter permease [Deltaproteobacteria bacterium]MBW1962142.1 branched-chain amino acid ABC transporter permease [Deltaproteobacteria bacterium]MBW2152703.1 branched-chain amino acid ABC transporter permease [Deltaproteobacteria bacterium]
MEISQIIANTLVRGAELSLLAIGLTMIFDILKFANFAHPDYAVLGAFFAYVCNRIFGLNLVLSILIAAFATGCVGILIDKAIFKRLRVMGAKPVTLMIASMGTAIAMRNLMRLIWTSHTKSYAIPIKKPLVILGARITPLQIAIIFSGLLSMVAFHLLLHRTTFGKALRAISDNSELASACAIDSEKMIRWMWFLASAYAVLGGAMIAMEHLLYPRLGFDIIIPVFCAAILGGIGNPYGAMLGALTLALAENVMLALDFSFVVNLGGLFNVNTLQISTGYKPAISFVILIIVLLFKPTGILRKK